jgi:hypothetical protein
MFELSTNVDPFFRIPEDMIGKTPCQKTPILFEDPALDIDLDDAEWLALDSNEQQNRLMAKRTAEETAVAACNTCPLLDACKEWAMKIGGEVFGVVGGTTTEERIGSVSTCKVAVDTKQRGPQGQVRDDLIAKWSKEGLTNKNIADRLGCAVRTVERRKIKLADGTGQRFDGRVSTHILANLIPVEAGCEVSANRLSPATSDLEVNRVSTETAFIYDLLMDGGLRDRNAVIETAVTTIDRNTALTTAPDGRIYEDDDSKASVGARKFIMNRIDIAVRRGRVIIMRTESGKTLICMEPNAARTWTQHREPTSVEPTYS